MSGIRVSPTGHPCSRAVADLIFPPNARGAVRYLNAFSERGGPSGFLEQFPLCHVNGKQQSSEPVSSANGTSA